MLESRMAIVIYLSNICWPIASTAHASSALLEPIRLDQVGYSDDWWSAYSWRLGRASCWNQALHHCKLLLTYCWYRGQVLW
jgi:hypothetical protein